MDVKKQLEDIINDNNIILFMKGVAETVVLLVFLELIIFKILGAQV